MVKINLKNTVTPVAADKVLISSDASDANSTKQALVENIAKTTKLDDLTTPDDNTDLNATITYHGLCPKLSGNPAQALLGDGSWGALGGTGDVVGPGTSNNNYLALFNGVTGKLLKQATIPIYWDGSLGLKVKIDESAIVAENTAGTNTASLNTTDGWSKAIFTCIHAAGEFWAGIFDDIDATVWTIGVTGTREIAFGNNGTKRIRILSTGQIEFNTAYTFPMTDGTNGQALVSNGSGALSFGDVAQTSLEQTFTTDATGVTVKDLVEKRKSDGTLSKYMHIYKTGRVPGADIIYNDDEAPACDIVSFGGHKVLSIYVNTATEVTASVGVKDPGFDNMSYTQTGNYTILDTYGGVVDQLKMCAFNDNLALVFVRSSVANTATLYLVKVNGWDVELVAEILWCDTTAPDAIDIVSLDKNTAVVAASFAGEIQFQIIKVSNDDRIFRYSKVVNTDPVTDVTSLALSKIDSNSFMIAYNDTGSSTYGYLTHCEITQSQNIIFSTRAAFYSTAACNYIDVQMLGGLTGVVSYADTGSGTNCRVKAFSYEEDGTFTLGSEVQPFSSATACTFTRLEKISNSHYVILAKTNTIHYNTGLIYAGQTIYQDSDQEKGGGNFEVAGVTDASLGTCSFGKNTFIMVSNDTGDGKAKAHIFDVKSPLSNVVGIALETKGAAQSCNVCVAGIAEVTGLTAGSSYYCSAAGSLSNTASSTGVKVGVATSTTELLFHPEWVDNPNNESLDSEKSKISGDEGKINGWTKFTPPYSRTSDSVFNLAPADMNQMIRMYPIAEGTPIRFRQDFNDEWSFAIVTAYSESVGQVTISGDPYTAAIHADATRQFEIGPPEKVISKRYFISGTFANAVDADLLANDMDQYEQWSYKQARLVRIAHRVKTADSGVSQPRVNAVINGQPMDQSNGTAGLPVSTSWVYSGVNLDSFNTSYMNDITIQTDANGTNNDASDLTMIMTFVLI